MKEEKKNSKHINKTDIIKEKKVYIKNQQHKMNVYCTKYSKFE